MKTDQTLYLYEVSPELGINSCLIKLVYSSMFNINEIDLKSIHRESKRTFTIQRKYDKILLNLRRCQTYIHSQLKINLRTKYKETIITASNTYSTTIIYDV